VNTTRSFIRGAPWPRVPEVPYPRADPADRRLPADTWTAACIPAGVRLELTGDARAIELDYITTAVEPGYRGAGAGVTFDAWTEARQMDEQPAAHGTGTVTLRIGAGARTVVYLPEGMRPEITGIRAVGGQISPAPALPRWVAYGDSITEGWVARSPARNWVAMVSREVGLDAINLGYAGSARGELASAEQIAGIEADLITVAFGTNCWTMVPHTADMVAAVASAFLRVLRQAHPVVPIIVISPLIRPDAEAVPNRLGSTLADIRLAVEDAAASDALTRLIPGRDLVAPDLLPDGVHPGDEGHRLLADTIGATLRSAVPAGTVEH
jgi:lysophospholipase L1-like esterase